jgi:UPF0755 protein
LTRPGRALLVAALSSLALAILVYDFHRRWLDRPLPVREAVLIEVATGEALGPLADRLAAAGFLDHPRLFELHARAVGRAERIQAGEYRLVPGITPRSLLDDLVLGRVVTYDARIVEGATLAQALDALRAAPKLVDDLGGATPDDVLARLGLGQGPGEGRFFPDTYRYTKGTRASAILRIAFARMEAVLSQAWATRDPALPYRSPYEALIVASMVEKETGIESDRDKVSRVFASRLARGMRLQSDPTVIYGLGAAFDGDLRRIHLDTDGPYNTYRRGGLPPTPIALPGAASIHAAMRPADGSYLYFVARGDGSSEFSSSLAEHEAAVRRYQLRGNRSR